MADPLECPHCSKMLTDSEVSTLYGRMTNARRKTKSGGHRGGRRASVPICSTLPEAPEDAKGYPPESLAEVKELCNRAMRRLADTTNPEDAKFAARVLVPIEDL